jgi:hypothetical protein
MQFAIDNFHFFDKKLFEEPSNTIIFYDLDTILQKRKIDFPNHYFIVVHKNNIVSIDPNLTKFIQAINLEDKIQLKLNSPIEPLSIYLIQLHYDDQTLHIDCSGDSSITIFHENIVSQKGHSTLNLSTLNPLDYYHVINNETAQLFYQEILLNTYHNTNVYFSQKLETGKTKIDLKINLYNQSIFNFNMLSHIVAGQLRDDSVEVIHHDKNSISRFNYFSLNSGKSVSQINSIIKKDASNSETHQSIKHVLLNESGQSYSKPNLMISNPLVVASHGNSIGSFNLDNLFYLRQKGLSETSAKLLISKSYIYQFCDNSKYPQQLLYYFNGTKNA